MRVCDYNKVAEISNLLILKDTLEKKPSLDSIAMSYWNRPTKLLSSMVIFFCIEGEIRIKSNMTEFKVGKNDVYFTRNGIISEVISASPDIRMAFVMLTDELYFPVFNGMDTSQLQRTLVTNPVRHISDVVLKECLALYKLMRDRINTNEDTPIEREIVKGYMQALLFIVYQQFNKEEQKDALELHLSRQKEQFNTFMRLLQQHYTCERNISFYADKMCITPRYLSRIIRETSGHFASEHIDLFVVAEAKQLLRSNKYTVSQVSQMLNFGSQSQFGRYFKKFTGYSPKQYQGL